MKTIIDFENHDNLAKYPNGFEMVSTAGAKKTTLKIDNPFELSLLMTEEQFGKFLNWYKNHMLCWEPFVIKFYKSGYCGDGQPMDVYQVVIDLRNFFGGFNASASEKINIRVESIGWPEKYLCCNHVYINDITFCFSTSVFSGEETVLSTPNWGYMLIGSNFDELCQLLKIS